MSGDAMTDADDSPLHLPEILKNPDLLEGKSPHEIENAIAEAKQAGWIEGRLGKGAHIGQGFILREVQDGKQTGRIIQWHPGGGRHGSPPYWKVSSAAGGTVRVGPQFAAPHGNKDE